MMLIEILHVFSLFFFRFLFFFFVFVFRSPGGVWFGSILFSSILKVFYCPILAVFAYFLVKHCGSIIVVV